MDKDSDIAGSSCIMKCEYKCLQYQTCGKNADGKCGWSTNLGQENEYRDCMKECGIKVDTGDSVGDGDCKKAGCSSELCVDKDSDIAGSVCLWKCEYKCLQYQTCGKNEDDKCEWETNIGSEDDYKQCMKGCGIDDEGGEKICACQDIYDPICCNGTQYDNSCMAECHGIVAPAKERQECYVGECKKDL